MIKKIKIFFISNNMADIIFVVLFFILLFIPMSHISNEERSDKENRMLANRAILWQNNHFNYNFGNDFEKWFNDRFFGRDILLYLNFFIFSFRGITYNDIVGKDGFLYLASSINLYVNNNLFSDKELKIIGENIQTFVNDAQNAGVDHVYFMLSNDKESMYPEYYPSYIKKYQELSRLQQLLNYMHTNYPNINFFNFRDEFEDIKKTDIVFYKTGTHMNHLGAFYEYYFLTHKIKNDYPELSILTLDDFNISISDDINHPDLNLDIYNNFFILPRYNKANFRNKILKPKSNIKSQIKSYRRSDGEFISSTNKKVKNKIKVFLIGDSFSGKYSMHLFNTFYAVACSIFWHVDFILPEPEEEYLRQHIPDVLIVETSERYLSRFSRLKFPSKSDIKD